VLHFRNLLTHTRKLFTGACDLSVGVREPFIGAWGRGHPEGHLRFKVGMEFIGASLFRPTSSQG